MISLFGFGFLLGMQHALEADHLAAIASLTSEETSPRRSMVHGATWGIGHSLTLLLFGGVVLIFGVEPDVDLSRWLEFIVGGMLIALGSRVLFCLWRERIHIHTHSHADGVIHIHAHSHKLDNENIRQKSQHAHAHRPISRRKFIGTLSVGMMHGMAGSAALIILLAATRVDSIFEILGYIVVFGIGSVLGMAALSLVMVVPASLLVRTLPSLLNFMRLSVGAGTSLLGGYVVVMNWPA